MDTDTRAGRPAPGRTQAAVLESLRVDIAVREAVILVTLDGPLDIYTAPGFREDLDSCAQAGAQIVVDLSAVTLIDSAGLAALLSLSSRAHRDGGRSLGLVCPQRHLRRVFEVTGLLRAFDFGRTSSAPARAPGPVPSPATG